MNYLRNVRHDVRGYQLRWDDSQVMNGPLNVYQASLSTAGIPIISKQTLFLRILFNRNKPDFFGDDGGNRNYPSFSRPIEI